MQVLLDTPVILWWLMGDQVLERAAQRIIEDPQNRVFVSAASGLEISIKRSLGKLRAPGSLFDRVLSEGFLHLPVSFQHGERVGALTLLHRDPFDRILVAQAQLENLVILTRDQYIPLYDVTALPA